MRWPLSSSSRQRYFRRRRHNPDYPARIAQQVEKVRTESAESNASVPFHASWESLASYRTPDWFRDAKFGIFLHWGVYSIPAFGNEWYSRNMYIPGNAAYKHQIATYGPLDKFGYKDFIPLFRARHFDPNAWLDLFVKAGARYIVPVAEHCDGFAMYASSMTPYNAAEMGPHRDVVGELERATRVRGCTSVSPLTPPNTGGGTASATPHRLMFATAPS